MAFPETAPAISGCVGTYPHSLDQLVQCIEFRLDARQQSCGREHFRFDRTQANAATCVDCTPDTSPERRTGGVALVRLRIPTSGTQLTHTQIFIVLGLVVHDGGIDAPAPTVGLRADFPNRFGECHATRIADSVACGLPIADHITVDLPWRPPAPTAILGMKYAVANPFKQEAPDALCKVRNCGALHRVRAPSDRRSPGCIQWLRMRASTFCPSGLLYPDFRIARPQGKFRPRTRERKQHRTPAHAIAPAPSPVRFSAAANSSSSHRKPALHCNNTVNYVSSIQN